MKDRFMKKMMVVFLIFIGLLPVNIYAQDKVLTNSDVIDMISMKFSENIIITKIKTSKTDFKTTVEDLKLLKSKGISDAIIMAMMKMDDSQGVELKQADNKNGIYIKVDGEFKKLLPTVFSGTKANTLASMFSYGIASTKIRSTMNKVSSSNIINSNTPEFYFYFVKKQNDSFSLTPSNWWFGAATSPNEFSLVKLIVKKNRRELETGTMNAYAGTSIGVNEKQIVEFKIEQLDEFSFKVTPNTTLEAGEYCFFYQGTIPQGGFVNQSAFDFSIQN